MNSGLADRNKGIVDHGLNGLPDLSPRALYWCHSTGGENFDKFLLDFVQPMGRNDGRRNAISGIAIGEVATLRTRAVDSVHSAYPYVKTMIACAGA